ncbi:MAG: hypothetical protein NC911_01760 [Candidatus Omnitrophica bacterium]|nr:hypothetical protein [Candidatus Omnitrophota bacterium]
MRKFTFALLTLVVFSVWLSGAEKRRYWELGWGLYGGDGLDAARFDWHMVCFGNIPADQRTVDKLNEILRINPNHKLLIRVWPIGNLGDCPENRYQATLFHYLYQPGVREKVLAEARRQVELVCKGINRPENVYGCCFLEELPGHFTSGGFSRNWKKGDPLPWDIQRFKKEIEAELGEPVDCSSEKHRLWWGKKYTQVINEINKTIKEASGGKYVFYYQATGYYTLDHLDLPFAQGKSLQVVPIRYSDILKPGVCDGIFGYPNNQAIWENQTQAMVKKYLCLMFSQISMPPGMRLCRFDEMVNLARWEHPGNVGTFLYGTHGRKEKAWNALDYQDAEKYWTLTDHIRHFGWVHKIGLEIVNRNLMPQLGLVYNLKGLKKGQFAHFQVQVVNVREPSWYGGNAEEAVLKQVKVTLSLPRGFSLPVTNNASPTLNLGDIPGQGAKLADWWVQAEVESPIVSAKSPVKVILTAAGGLRQEILADEPVSTLPSFETRLLRRSGEKWVEPLYSHQQVAARVELKGFQEIANPQLILGTRNVLYQGVLTPEVKLVIGPGARARLFPVSLFEEKVRVFPSTADGPAIFKSGYMIYGTPTIPVRPGAKYLLTVTGWAKEGGNSLVLARFTGQRKGKKEPEIKDISCLANRFSETEKTISQEITVPELESEEVTLRLMFYRFQSKGEVCYRSFDLVRADIPPEGQDVSHKLLGALPDLTAPFTEWTYQDQSDPDKYGRPILSLRFLSPEE